MIYESKTGVAPDKLPLVGVTPAEAMPVPIADMAQQTAGTDKAKNTVVLGLLAGWFGIGRESILAGIRKKLAKKGPKVVEAAENAFAAGVEYAEPASAARARGRWRRRPARAGTKLLTDGNDMCAAAAIFAGCQFFGGYPITPSTEVMQFLTPRDLEVRRRRAAGRGRDRRHRRGGRRLLRRQEGDDGHLGPGHVAQDRRSWAWRRIAELPLVVVNVQRGGPSTGMPTKSEQADLFQAAFSAHGDVLRPVLAPTSVADTFDVTVEAFNIAEHYQTPVIVLSDQEIAQRKETVDPIDTSQLHDRWSGVRPTRGRARELRALPPHRVGHQPDQPPGHAGRQLPRRSGIEHNEHGAPDGQRQHARAHEREALPQVRAARASGATCSAIEGDPNAPLALVSWGSSAGVCREALDTGAGRGPAASSCWCPTCSTRWPRRSTATSSRPCSAGLVVEQSHQGQLYRILRMYLDVPAGVESLLPQRRQSRSSPPRSSTRAARDAPCSLQRRQRDDAATPGVRPQ